MPELCTFYSLYMGSTFQEATFAFQSGKVVIPIPAEITERIIAILCEELTAPAGLLLDSIPA